MSAQTDNEGPFQKNPETGSIEIAPPFQFLDKRTSVMKDFSPTVTYTESEPDPKD